LTTETNEDSQPASPEESEMEETRMSLLEHLAELRTRLRNAGIAFIISMFIAFWWKEKVFEILSRPIRNGLKRAEQSAEFVMLSPTEAFWVYFKLAIVWGLLMSAPFIFWELWKFVAPGLYRKERRMSLTVIGATGLCFTGGAIFGYFTLMEPATYFLSSFAGHIPGPEGGADLIIKDSYSMERVSSFITMMLFGCGVAFELPVVVSVLGALGIVSAKALWKFNKYSLILSALLGGILTPGGDVVSQLLLAGPIFVLYNISIGIVALIERARSKKAAEMEAEYTDGGTAA
jgi:sec-independent protein translocase protein TatC